MNEKRIISIVGAGPGDPELLTVKAMKRVQQADVLLYDNLVSEEIINLFPENAQKIYVGRKYGDHSDQETRQQLINEELKKFWLEGKKVVRLKSGDPYIFGRAAEEARYLKAQKIPFEMIPGITAALGAANSFNIPLTERRNSNAVMICTAQTADDSLEHLESMANTLKAGNTLAIYMGIKSLEKLIPKLTEVCGTDQVAINAISNVSRENEKVVSGTLRDIHRKIQESDLQMPVVFIVGTKPIAE